MLTAPNSQLLQKDLLAEVAVTGLMAPCQQTPDLDPSRGVLSSRVMIVDDEAINVKLVRKVLREIGFGEFSEITDPRQTLDSMRRNMPDIILLDIRMPDVNGLELLAAIRANEQWRHIPIVILTAVSDRATKLEALQLGATDVLCKPVDRAELILRVKNALMVKACHDQFACHARILEQQVKQRTQEVVTSRLEVVQCLARAAEFHDDITGKHVVRVGRYAGVIGAAMGLDANQVHLLELAAQLHDVGKIGIPVELLKKEGPLTDEEYRIVQDHCLIGKGMFDQIDEHQWDFCRQHPALGNEMSNPMQSPLVQMASRIALTHHEYFDGSGYPLGLAGNDIPLEGRITAVADVFDALTCRRPYKQAYSVTRSFEILQQGRSSQFDPDVLDAFFQQRDDIVAIQIQYAD